MLEPQRLAGPQHVAEPGGGAQRDPSDLYDEVLAAGWGEPHPISGTMMLFGPRDEQELVVAWRILHASWRWAHSGLTSPLPDGD